MNHNIETYSRDCLPDKNVWENIGVLLEKNYPESYSQKSKSKTLSKRNTSEKVNDRIKNWYIYITLEDTRKQVLWFLEMRKIRVEWGVYIELCWLVIDKLFQGKWLARILHNEFERKAQEIWETVKWNLCLQLWTWKDNPARGIYIKWWYKEYNETGADIFMIKDI